MAISLRTKIEFAVAAVLLLASCDSGGFKSKFSDAERDEIADIAADACADTIASTDLNDRVDQLESKLN